MKRTLRALRKYRRKLRRRLRQRKEAKQKFQSTHNKKYAREVKQDAQRAKYLGRLISKMLRRQATIEVSHREGIDWAYGDVSPKVMIDNGKTFACRYLSHDRAKSFAVHEAIMYSRAGIDLIVVWEDGGEGARSGYVNGRSDANTALAKARILGKPDEAPIFFAVDFDAEGPEVEGYFRGVASILGKQAGIYAGLDAVEYILDRKIVSWAWQTYAWSNHHWDKRAKLKQVLISLEGAELTMDGIHVDYDKSTAINFGQWRSKLA